MSKKVVGLVVATVIIVVLMLAVLIGGLRLRKDNASSSGNLPRTEVNSSQQQQQPSSSSPNTQTQGNNVSNQSSTVDTGQSTDVSQNVQNNKELVDKVVKQSSPVNNNDSVSTTMTPSNGTLNPQVYQMNGVVKELTLVNDNNGIQSFYKALIEIPMGNQTIDLDYLTTSGSAGALKVDTRVVVSYQLTTDNKVVIKGLNLSN